MAKYLHSNFYLIKISNKKGEKPYLLNPNSSMKFNISHSGDWVIIGIADREVGVDIEYIKPGFEFRDIISEHFSEAEQSFINKNENPLNAFYYLWTRKEALTKAWGTGLQENLKMISVEDESRTYEMQGKIWNLKSFNISPDYPAAVAYEGTEKAISFYDGSSLLA